MLAMSPLTLLFLSAFLRPTIAQAVIGLFDASGSPVSMDNLPLPASTALSASRTTSSEQYESNAYRSSTAPSTGYAASATITSVPPFLVPTPVPDGTVYTSTEGDSCGEWGCGKVVSPEVQSTCAPAVMSWAHSSMKCGYGHVRNSAGYCMPASWYSTSLGCYETTIILRRSRCDRGDRVPRNLTLSQKPPISLKAVMQRRTRRLVQNVTITEKIPVTMTESVTLTRTMHETSLVDLTTTEKVTDTVTKTSVYNQTIMETATETKTLSLPTTVISKEMMTVTSVQAIPTTVVSTQVMTEVMTDTVIDTKTLLHTLTDTQIVQHNLTKVQTQTEVKTQTQLDTIVQTDTATLTHTLKEIATETMVDTVLQNISVTQTQLQTLVQTQLATLTEEKLATSTANRYRTVG
ncbi:hypothetical protein BD324DRAFT_608960 [Kockovaella imperatae]|uniref:CBM1 domain-containing protein n=1 Tax=Kockovaella imperatae TaxID=4999 RepID=A0A1Y1UE08_9TREE|nr:hypothetical protein BD324DRAFT_608960 [Kockovaella imperatae]ORX36252.1 hypothetical protein BD324DRAFT_608960 [Kockovaella imperatae]